MFRYIAVDHGDYLEYRHVPYAKPPVGELRFRPPQPLWKEDCPDTGYLNTTDYAPACIQYINHRTPPWNKEFFADERYLRPLDEDCLYLNIWTPKENDPVKRFPVAVWIHGGAYLNGYATEMEFDGAAYARRGVILVSVEYRCNFFGFLAHPWLSAENDRGISGNYGLLDQIMAIDWVKKHISKFGGDPLNLTVFGQSAGAASVQTLITSPLSKGRISRCILLSGAAYRQGLCRDISLERQETYGKRLAEYANIRSVEELRELPALELFERMNPEMGRIAAEHGGFFLMPCMDGYLLNDTFAHALESGNVEDIPIITGWTRDDYDVMGDTRALVTAADLLSGAAPETAIKAGCIGFAEVFRSYAASPIYLYSFDRLLPGDHWGAFHSAELYYVFGTLARSWRPFTKADAALSDRLLDSWTNFMKTGDPDAEDSWRPYSKKDPFIMKWDVESQV